MKGTVSTNIDERGLVISLNNTLFFDTGKAEIKPDSQKKLIEIGKILNKKLWDTVNGDQLIVIKRKKADLEIEE